MKKYSKYKKTDIDWIGEIPEGWALKKVKYTFKFDTGFTPPTKVDKYYQGGTLNWVTITDLKGKYVSDTENKITQSAVNELNKFPIPKGSLLYSFKLSVGKVAFTTKDTYTNEAIFSIFPLKGLNLDYYYYSLPKQILYNANENIYGAKILNQELIKNAYIIVPSSKEQTAIATYLDHKTALIDKLITSNEKQIKLLEEKRKATINRAVTKGLDPNVKMKDSGVEWIGKIPEGWEVKKLKWVFETIGSGDGVRSSDINKNKGDYEAIGGNGVMGFISKFNKSGIGIAIGRVGANCGNVHLLNGKYFVTDNALYAKISENYNTYFVENALRNLDLNRFASKTAQPLITQTLVGEKKLPFPLSKSEQTKIVEYIEDFLQKNTKLSISIKKQNKLLKEYRQSLISHVVTGKVKVI